MLTTADAVMDGAAWLSLSSMSFSFSSNPGMYPPL
jgi:hypothetical protein